jgi:putative hemolysin
MKILLLLILVSTNIRAEEYFFTPERNKTIKIKFEKLNGVLVNDLCLKEKKECLKLIDSIKKNKIETVKTDKKAPLGNPASTNCEAHQGQSEILRDAKHNEYDFCVLDKKYFVDSWDLMK